MLVLNLSMPMRMQTPRKFIIKHIKPFSVQVLALKKNWWSFCHVIVCILAYRMLAFSLELVHVQLFYVMIINARAMIFHIRTKDEVRSVKLALIWLQQKTVKQKTVKLAATVKNDKVDSKFTAAKTVKLAAILPQQKMIKLATILWQKKRSS